MKINNLEFPKSIINRRISDNGSYNKQSIFENTILMSPEQMQSFLKEKQK